MKNKQTIKCSVEDCMYNSCNFCSLKEIKVCNCDNKENKKSTMCDSYNKKDI